MSYTYEIKLEKEFPPPKVGKYQILQDKAFFWVIARFHDLLKKISFNKHKRTIR